MSTWLFYVDESYDQSIFCLSALAIRDRDWKRCFDAIREHRRQLKRIHGILLTKEIHAHDFVRGRGRLGDKIVTKYERSEIFRGVLRCAASLPSAMLFNVCLQRRNTPDAQMIAWDRLINRIERTLRRFEETEASVRQGLILQVRNRRFTGELLASIEQRLLAYRPRAVIIADEGREKEITKALRRMHVHNPIPSKFGEWEDGATTKNILANRIMEDPVFKHSDRSYFLQFVDCIAFALLKRESPNRTPLVEKYRIHAAFDETVTGICYVRACGDDPLGIVRK